MDITASVIAIWQLTSEVIQYLNDVRNAPKECQQCAIEASNLLGSLTSLRYLSEQAQMGDPWFEQLRKMNVKDGPLDQYKQALELLRTAVEVGDRLQKVKRRLLWKFTKEQVTGILARIDRLKSLVSVALQMDHRNLSDAIKDDTDFIRASLPPLQASSVAIEAGIHTLHNGTRSVKDDTVSIRDALPPLQASAAAVRDAQNLRHHQEVVDWLSRTDFPGQQHDIIAQRQEGTAQWFLDSAEFKDWLHGPDKILFCPGIPGAGKTMMAAVAIDHLCRATHSTDVGIAYLFCSYKAQVDQTAPNLLAALLKQLVQGRPDIAAPVTDLHDQHTKRQTKPSLDELTLALLSICSSYSTVYVVVDALDECSSRDGVRRQLIDRLRSIQASRNVHLLFTSRFIPEVTEEFQYSSSLEVRASEEDVKHYVAGQMSRLPKCIHGDDGLKSEIQTKIVEAVDGMFLLARLHINSLLDKRNKQRVLSTLNKLPKGSAALEDAYGEAIKRIDGQLEEDRLLARRALCWISYAQRLLTTTELCHALAIEPGDQVFNVDNVYEVGDIISVCAGIVTVDDESGIIRLVHYTTQEYFENVRLDWNPSAQEQIAMACLTYLSFDAFKSGSCPSDDSFEQRQAENRFLNYSACYWSEHLRPVQDCTPVSELALAFLRSDALMDSVIQVASISDLKYDYKYDGYSRKFPGRTRGLHLAARYGLLYLSQRLLVSESRDWMIAGHLKDSHNREPLYYATSYSHKAIVKLLIEAGADVNAQDGSYNALYAASYGGRKEIVKLLVDMGADVNLQSEYGSALYAASLHGDEAIVKLLVKAGVDVNAQGGVYGSALLAALIGGHKQIVKLLAEAGADVNTGRGFYVYGNALHAASSDGDEEIVKLLVEIGADVNAGRGSLYGSPLQAASYRSHEAIVKLLIGAGATW